MVQKSEWRTEDPVLPSRAGLEYGRPESGWSSSSGPNRRSRDGWRSVSEGEFETLWELTLTRVPRRVYLRSKRPERTSHHTDTLIQTGYPGSVFLTRGKDPLQEVSLPVRERNRVRRKVDRPYVYTTVLDLVDRTRVSNFGKLLHRLSGTVGS